MPIITRRAAIAGGLALPGLALPSLGRGQGAAWRPSQTIRIIVPAAPGGTADITARLLAPFLQSHFGQNCVADNRSGAGGTIGTAEAVRATPDGHTLLLGNIGPQAIGLSLFRNLPYTKDSLAPVCGMVRGPNVLVVHPTVPAQSVPELVALAEGRAGQVQLWLPRCRPVAAPHRRVVQPGDGDRVDPRAVPRRRPGGDRAGGGQHQLHVGQPHQRHPADARRQRARAGGEQRRPQPAAARRAGGAGDDAGTGAFDVNTWFGIFVPAATPRPVAQSIKARCAPGRRPSR